MRQEQGGDGAAALAWDAPRPGNGRGGTVWRQYARVRTGIHRPVRAVKDHAKRRADMEAYGRPLVAEGDSDRATAPGSCARRPVCSECTQCKHEDHAGGPNAEAEESCPVTRHGAPPFSRRTSQPVHISLS